MKMKIFKSILFPFFLCALCASFSFALEIPISGALQRENNPANGILFVDMEKIFQAHPMTERSKTELKNFAQTRKNAIDEMVKAHDELQKQAQTLNAQITEARTANNETAVTELSRQLDEKKKSLSDQRSKIADLSSRTKTELALMEEKNSLAVLKDIEIVLKEVSDKHDADIVLDRQSVLCGSDSCEDVTDEVIKKLEGR